MALRCHQYRPGIGLFAVGFVSHLIGQPHVIPFLAEILGDRDRLGLLWILLHLLLGQRAGQFSVRLIDDDIESVFESVADFVPEIAEQHLGVFLAVFAVAIAVAGGDGNVIIIRPNHPAGTGLAAHKTEAASLDPDAGRRGVVTGEGNEIYRTAQAQPAVLQGVGPAIDLGVFEGADVEVLQNDFAVALVQRQSVN